MSKHPVPSTDKRFLYWDWVKSEAALIGTDGCSKVLGFHVECCLEHDLGYHYGRDPRDAYRAYRDGYKFPWCVADRIERGEVDKRFRVCLQVRSKAGQYSPASWWRWLGVRIGGRGAWSAHRRRQEQEDRACGNGS